jgi:hypothetical protein
MAFEQREMSGSLFKNDKRTEENGQPHAQGKALIGGVLYYVSAWTKRDKNDQPWQSLSFKPVAATAKPAAKANAAIADMDSDLPWKD